MTPHQYSVMAALMAHSNMGLDTTSIIPVAQRLLRGECRLDMTVEEASGHLSAAWIESDEIEQTFYEEARGWEKLLKDRGIVQVYKSWPWLAQVISPRELEPAYDELLEKEEARACS